MNHVVAVECRRCGRRYAPEDVTYTCPVHDGDDDGVSGVLDVRYDDDGLREHVETEGVPDSPADLWAFESFLPVGAGRTVSLGAGGTPLHEAPRLSDRLDTTVRIKDEAGNPTGASKDRGTAVVVTRAVQAGHDVVTCASTGNAAASLAGYAARAGLDCQIFVPADIPDGKAVQPRLYGADVLAVEGTYEDAYECCRTVSADRGWYNRSAALNPYAVEGTRTLGFELGRQAPTADWVVMPMGNGCSLAAVWKGLAEFARLGLLADPPRMLGVQAAGATAIYDRFVGEDEPGPERATGTAADSIDVTGPHNAARACRALEESGGDAVVVDDDSILRAQRLVGESEGLFVEPASAAAIAGVERARETGIVGVDDEVVVVATGTGLKDTATAERAVGPVRTVSADPDELPEL
ncbi:threonine synthase [Halobacteriales archaeon QH_10_67_22]|nr:MAG: threonine synthase [Halobacteriales archaeon QH_10_67_22]